MLDRETSQQAAAPGHGLRIAGDDARLQPGAYITDEVELYEVTGVRRGPMVMGIATARVGLENCRTLRSVEFGPDHIRRRFRLVRCAPAGLCPDVVEQIAW